MRFRKKLLASKTELEEVDQKEQKTLDTEVRITNAFQSSYMTKDL